MALVVNLERDGKRLRFLLDIHEVAEGHTGVVLAREFEETLQSFGLVEKVSLLSTRPEKKAHRYPSFLQ